MSDRGFEVDFTGHEAKARKLLLKKGLKSAAELALMTTREVEQAINAEYESIRAGDAWLLVPKDRYDDFASLVTEIGK